MNTIVVGIDGSPVSVSALRYAIREAQLRGDRVRAVTAWHVPAVAYGAGLTPAVPYPADYKQAAADLLARSLAEVDPGDVPVEGVVREGESGHVLIEEAQDAEQLVVGCHDRSLLGRLLHHSVSGECAHAAPCPVTVVHG